MFFWNSLAFSMIQRMLAIWSLVPLPFLKPAWTFESSRFTYCWSLAWRILSITLLACAYGILKITWLKVYHYFYFIDEETKDIRPTQSDMTVKCFMCYSSCLLPLFFYWSWFYHNFLTCINCSSNKQLTLAQTAESWGWKFLSRYVSWTLTTVWPSFLSYWTGMSLSTFSIGQFWLSNK